MEKSGPQVADGKDKKSKWAFAKKVIKNPPEEKKEEPKDKEADEEESGYRMCKDCVECQDIEKDVFMLEDFEEKGLYQVRSGEEFRPSMLDVSVQHDDGPVDGDKTRVEFINDMGKVEVMEVPKHPGKDAPGDDIVFTEEEVQALNEQIRQATGDPRAGEIHAAKKDQMAALEKEKKNNRKNKRPMKQYYDVYTGFFEDTRRRGDLVLVVGESLSPDVESVRLEYFSGLVKTGFELEVELGRLSKNSHVQFVKVHAPDTLLVAYTDALGVKKHFKNNHLEYMVSSHSHETLWVKYLRNQTIKPLMYSNIERSYIVWLLLQTHTFGNPANFYGLPRLIESKTVVDAYALHDGPYFNTFQNDFKTFNGRQILYLYWAGLRNWYRRQPIHVLQEYYGTRIAFFYLFWEYYITGLLFASLWGIIMSIMYLVKDKDYLKPVRQETCKTSRRLRLPTEPPRGVCAECSDSRIDHCPYSLTIDHCPDLKLLQFVDSPYMILYSFGMVFFALLFLMIWRRLQSYYTWIWEEYYSAERQVVKLGLRPPLTRVKKQPQEESHGPKKKPLSETASTTATDIGVSLLATVIIALVIFIFFFLIYINLRSSSAKKLTNLVDKTKFTIVPLVKNSKQMFILFLIAIVAQVVLYAAERAFHVISKYLVNLWDLRTMQEWEEYLAMKYFFFSLSFVAAPVTYFLFVKGALYNSPVDIVKGNVVVSVSSLEISFNLFSTLVDFLNHNCNPFSCFRQAVIVFFATILVRVVAVRVIAMAANGFSKLSPVMVKDIPACEREFELKPYTELNVLDDYNSLFVQIALLFLFAPVCPLAPLLLLVINIIDLRIKATTLLVKSRRVVMFSAPGIGYWNRILVLIVLASPLFHAAILTRTEIFKIYTMNKLHSNETKEKFLFKYMMEPNYDRKYGVKNKLMPTINLTEYKFLNKQKRWYLRVLKCRVDGFLDPLPKKKSKKVWPLKLFRMQNDRFGYTPQPDHFHIKFIKTVFVLVYTNVMAILAILMWWHLPEHLLCVERAMMREMQLRRLYHHQLKFMAEDRVVGYYER